MKKALIVIFILLTLVIAAGCKAKTNGVSSPATQQRTDLDYGGNVTAEKSLATQKTEENEADMEQIKGESTARKVIFSASVSLETKDFDKSKKDIEAQIAALGGFTQDSSTKGDGSENNPRRFSATLRIPQDKFETFLSSVDNYGNITQQSKQGTDVSDSYYDNEARIKSLEIEETELRALMSSAKNISDIFTIQKRLTEIRQEIERLKGSQNKTDAMVAMSTITVYLHEVKSMSVKSGSGFGQQIKDTFLGSINILLAFLQFLVLAIIALSPLLVFAAIVVAIILIVIKKRKKSKKVE